ncbi:MAG: DUF3455 domain-containing protein [Janthinobacterium lividum]
MSKRFMTTLATLAVVAQPMGSAYATGVLDLHGRGVQVYRCETTTSGFAWILTGPEATLLTADGKIAGRHFAGPSWQATDGSVVVGEVVASGTLPDANKAAASIPWLILRAKSHTGSGRFGAVTHVVRSDTAGGTAPITGCGAGTTGLETRVPYTADYKFFGTG